MSDDEIKTAGGVYAQSRARIDGRIVDMHDTTLAAVVSETDIHVEAAMQHLDAEVGPRKPGQDVVVRIWVGWVDE